MEEHKYIFILFIIRLMNKVEVAKKINKETRLE